MTRAEIQGQAIFWAVLVELLLALMSLAMVANYRRAARGLLDRNAYVGVRISLPGRSREAWQAADRVAIRSIPTYVLLNAAIFAGLFAAAWHGWRLVVAFGAGLSFVVVLTALGWTSHRANKAANTVDHTTDLKLRRSAVLPAERPAPTRQLSERQKTGLAWVCAAIGCALALFLLGSLIDGYVLALHEQLVPADHFGLRDATTMSCWPRWYASQKAGFAWMVFGYGPVLIASVGIFVGAAVQRRPPQDFVLLVPGVAFSMLPFVIAASVHAESVAAAITC